MSKYEEYIISIFKKEHYNFELEKTFSDLKCGKYRFDIYLELKNKKICIEIDGEQHFYQVKKFHPTRADFLKAQAHDRQKISYCLSHGITLYRIPYWEIHNINFVKDIFQDKFIAKTKWHNDELWRKHNK